MPLGLGTAYGIKVGTDVLGSILGYSGQKKAQDKFDTSLGQLEGMLGRPLFNVGQAINANRRALVPKAREFGDVVAKRFNFDQPRAQQYFLDRLFDSEAQIAPGLIERSQSGTTRNDLAIRQAIAQLRASQL